MTPDQQKALEALQTLHAENERLGLYKDAYAQSTTTQTQVRSTEEALRRAIKAMKSFQEGTGGLYEGEFDEEIKAIEEALQSNEQELDYKAIGQQAYESGYSTGYMDCAVKMKAQLEQSTTCGEPVAWMDANDPNRMTAFKWENIGYHNTPLYITPPNRKPLTDEQRKGITAMWSREHRNYTVADIIDAVEEAHGIKE